MGGVPCDVDAVVHLFVSIFIKIIESFRDIIQMPIMIFPAHSFRLKMKWIATILCW